MHNEIQLFTEFPETKIYFKDNLHNTSWKEWRKWNECNDNEKNEANLRELFSNEVVLDVEDKKLLEQTQAILSAEDVNYEIWDSGSRGFHVHIFFDELSKKDETYKKVLRRKFIIKYSADLAKATEHSLIARPNKLHFKTMKQKTLMEDKSKKEKNFIPTYIDELVLEDINTKIIKKNGIIDIEFKDYFEKDKLFKFLKDRKDVIPLGCERNNVLIKNISIAAAKSGKSEKEFEDIFKPVMTKIMPDIPWNQVIANSSWYKKALKGDLEEYNQYELNIWGETYFNKTFYKIETIPVEIKEQLTEESSDLIERLLVLNNIALIHNLDNYLDKVKEITNMDIQDFLIGVISSKTFKKKSELKSRMNKVIKQEPVDIFSLEKKERAPVKWYIEKFLPENTGILIGAKPGKKKSLTVLTAMLSMKLNTPFLNEFKVNKPETKILYYDLENGEEVVKERFDYLVKSLKSYSKIKPDSHFKVVYSFDKHNLISELEIAKDYDIIVLDSYRRVLKGEENNSDVTDNFFNDFFKPLRDKGKTIIIIHHFKKGKLEDYEDTDALMDIFRGSSDVAAQFEIIYGLLSNNERSTVDGKVEMSDLYIKCVKNRRGLQIKNFTVEVTKDDNEEKTTFKYLGNKKFVTQKDTKKSAILSIIEERKEIHVDELKEAIKDQDIPDRTLSRYLQELVDDGTVKRNKHGLYVLPEILKAE
jgi:hypothetical protein